MKETQKNTLVVNLVGGPGSGKSTSAAGIFYNLKIQHYDVELINEFAKKLTWEENKLALSNQLYTTANQEYKQAICMGKVDAIITDSPIIIGLMYYEEKNIRKKDLFEQFIIESFKLQNNLTFYIERKKKYSTSGRRQTEEEAKQIDIKTKEFLDNNKIVYTSVPGTPDGLLLMVNMIIERLKNEKG